MVDLDFAVEKPMVAPYSAAPLLMFPLAIENRTPVLAIENVMLNCQIRIEAQRRAYSSNERDHLSELFGNPQDFSLNLRSLLWTHASLCVPAFNGKCRIDLPVPCSFDFNIAATKFFYGLDEGEAPLTLLFSGSVFYRDAGGALQIAQISWTKEASSQLPAAVWQSMMDQYYPRSAWLRLSRDAFDQLYLYKRERGLATFEQALDHLLQTNRESMIS
jgi:hypothetical protein